MLAARVLQATVLQRLEALPFDGAISFESSLAAWRYHRDHVLRDLATPPSMPATPQLELATPSSTHTALSRPLIVPGETCRASHADTASAECSSVAEPVEQPSLTTALCVRQETPFDASELTSSSASSEPGSGDVEPEAGHGGVFTAKDKPPHCGAHHSDNGCEQASPTSFRVTCTRGGRKHSFSSVEAASRLGSGLNQRFSWKVQMKHPDLEVLLNIANDSVSVGLALSQQSGYKRNIVEWGPTTLRATIAYGLLR